MRGPTPAAATNIPGDRRLNTQTHYFHATIFVVRCGWFFKKIINRNDMGYIVIKRTRGGVKPVERITVSKDRIYFSKPLCERLGLALRKKSVVLMVDNASGQLCLDFKGSETFPDAFPIRTHTNQHNSVTCVVYCGSAIESKHIPFGLYHIVSQDGDVYKTDCIVKLQ